MRLKGFAKKQALLTRTRQKIEESYNTGNSRLGLELSLLLSEIKDVVNEDYTLVKREIAHHEKAYKGDLSYLKEIL
jgi:hypothetical protein